MKHIHLSPEDVLIPDRNNTHDETEPPDDILQESRQILELIEEKREHIPFADTELARYQQLHHELQEHQYMSDYALGQWREALTQRWNYEIEGLRVYIRIHTILSKHFGEDSPYLKIVEPAYREGASTATDLLADLRRAHTTLKLVDNPPDDLIACMDHLDAVCTHMDEAITRTHHWQEKRHTAMLAQQLAHTAYQRASDHTRYLLRKYR